MSKRYVPQPVPSDKRIQGKPEEVLNAEGKPAPRRSITGFRQFFQFTRRDADREGAVAITRWNHVEYVLIAGWYYEEIAKQLKRANQSKETDTPSNLR